MKKSNSKKNRKSYNSARSKRILSHLILLGLNRPESIDLLDQIEKNIDNSGEEWTVGRLKDLKLWFIQHLAGNTSYKPSWFKSKSHMPDGIWGKLFKLALNSEKKIIKVLSMMMVYTSYISKSMTQKQLVKSLGSIQSTDTLTPAEQIKLHRLGQNYIKSFPTLKNARIKRVFTFASINTGKPGSLNGNSYFESYLDGLQVPFVSAYIEKYMGGPSALGLPTLWSDEEGLSPGVITVIQEKGYKARVVAMPKASVQTALKPLHLHLSNLLRQLPTDCTYNQESGALFAKKALSEGKEVYSVDLSGATDNFPLHLQLGVLNGLKLFDEENLIEVLSQSKWRLSEAFSDLTSQKYASYTKGQPMGLYGSFALFALTHNLVVMDICKQLSITGDLPFRILGDDIIITDKQVHSKYLEFLEGAKIPLSVEKCLTSAVMAEFAGYIITAKKIMKPAKVPSNNFDNNFIPYLKVMGHKGLDQLPSKSRRLGKLVLQLPEDLGGLGDNPQGIPRLVRVANYVNKDDDITIPYIGNVIPLLLQIKFRNDLTVGEKVFIDWLYDQYNTISNKMMDTIPKEFKNMPTSLVELAYQLSREGVTDVSSGEILAAVVAEESVEHVWMTEFSTWSDRFIQDVDNNGDIVSAPTRFIRNERSVKKSKIRKSNPKTSKMGSMR